MTHTLLPGAVLDGVQDPRWGASVELLLRCLRRMAPASFGNMAAFSHWQACPSASCSRQEASLWQQQQQQQEQVPGCGLLYTPQLSLNNIRADGASSSHQPECRTRWEPCCCAA